MNHIFNLPSPTDKATVRRQFEFILRHDGPARLDFGSHIWCILARAKPKGENVTEAEFREAFYGKKPSRRKPTEVHTAMTNNRKQLGTKSASEIHTPSQRGGNVIQFPKGAVSR